MTNPRIEKLAELMVRYSVAIEPGERLVLVGHPAAEPLLTALYRSALAAGALVDTRLMLPSAEEILLKTGNDEQLRFVTPMQELQIEGYDARIVVLAESNTRSLSSTDASRQAIASEARSKLIRRMLERTDAGEYRWASFFYPTDAYAQDAEMSREDFADFVYSACFLDDPDPISRWRELHRQQEELIGRLAGKSEIHIAGPDTDLTFSVAGRRWINCSGQKNMPDGEFFTCPIEDSTNGTVRFTYPAVAQGRLVEDVRLRFEAGQVVEASAVQNQDYLVKMLDSDEGARRLGEFAFGNNPRITRFTSETAFDEKIAGTVHMALGASITEAGGTNRSGVHWDLVCDLREGGQVSMDGEPFLKDGRFVNQ